MGICHVNMFGCNLTDGLKVLLRGNQEAPVTGQVICVDGGMRKWKILNNILKYPKESEKA